MGNSVIKKAKQVLSEANKLDQAVYVAVATSPTPSLDSALRKLSDAANYSRLSGCISLGLAVLGGSAGRRGG